MLDKKINKKKRLPWQLTENKPRLFATSSDKNPYVCLV